MRNFVIRADFECFVLLDDKELGILDGGELHFQKDKKFILTFFPIDNKTLPYACKVSFENGQIVCSSNLCRYLQLPMNNYELYFMPYLLSYRRPQLLRLQSLDTPIGKAEIRVYGGTEGNNTNAQVLINGEMQAEYEMTSSINNVSIQGMYINNEYFIIIQGNVQAYNYLMCIGVNSKVKVNLELLAHQVEIYEDCIKTLTKCFDINKHAKVCVYKAQNGMLNKVEEYLVLINENVHISHELIPYAFFEALQVGDINKCREYMSDELNQAIDDEHLKAYFGDFVEVRQNVYGDLNSVLLIYKEGDNYISKVCSLTLIANKIDNIDLED